MTERDRDKDRWRVTGEEREKCERWRQGFKNRKNCERDKETGVRTDCVWWERRAVEGREKRELGVRKNEGGILPEERGEGGKGGEQHLQVDTFNFKAVK